MEQLELLASLALPVGLVALVITAIVFRVVHKTVSSWAAWIALGLFVVLGLVQLIEHIQGTDITVGVDPPEVYACTLEGEPVELTVYATRLGRTAASRAIPKVSKAYYAFRPLSLETDEDGLLVEYEGCQVGKLSHDRLRDLGWLRSEEALRDGTPEYWYTYKVLAGETEKLGSCDYGALSICARQYTASGEAIVTLILEGHSDPHPSELSIENKSIEVQRFSGMPEFCIAVREADFTADPPWAAFSVFWIK